MRFKYEKDKELFYKLNDILKSVFFGAVLPCFKRRFPEYEVTVTRTIDDKIPGVSVSETHIQARAIDLRANDISSDIAKEIEIELNLLLADCIGAISLSDGKKRFAVLENIGRPEMHFHLQVAQNLPDDIILTLIAKGLSRGKS